MKLKPLRRLKEQPTPQEHEMATSIKNVREKMDVKPTKDDKGLICTLRITAYDNGMICVDDRAINSPADRTLGWVGAYDVIGTVLTEFYQQVKRRKTHRAA
jgi:hypothetical protein